MSLLRQTALRSSAGRLFQPQRIPAARLHASSVWASGKDSAYNDGEATEAEKQDQLKKQQQGKGHWKDALASESESAVKAERHETGRTAEEDTKKLQRETEEAPREKHNQ